MKQCPFCLREVNDQANFCKCGEPMRCPDLFGDMREIDEWLEKIEFDANGLDKYGKRDKLKDKEDRG